ncbi:hypothetical protein SAMN05421823_102259 [Catalinimonas alkaloidigena]|uniref:Zinc-ribbon domain-containing protein n=1 Tax=Catalinimonas alkaloidigena TaxID=1075417 RepID=A0A1G9AD58_9BACT|nr:putative zinc-binding peptidase [Catalinimonas alkaloidigena]SDK25317.1 hypothetical protein SAMN05421823_102259 [Catalinimonas alkaloidigena]
MKLFKCTHCGQLLYFENHQCVRCHYPLGFIPEKMALVPLVKKGKDTLEPYSKGLVNKLFGPSEKYRYCENHRHGVCNWLVPAQSQDPFCKACQLNNTIPNLSKEEYHDRWRHIEAAKHRLVYTLLQLGLPFMSKDEHPEKGLEFDFLADPKKGPRVLTGHANGTITLNIAEADDIEREMARKAMGEAYRTVLGHFRHEIAHYYWDRLVADMGQEEAFREVFGDEREDYSSALKRHYEKGTSDDWNQYYISPYASAHPWEDWAETWAHYLHMLDTLETAYAFGMSIDPELASKKDNLKADVNRNPYEVKKMSGLIDMWLPLTFAMNSLNRSMGHSDLYPFIIPPVVVDKLAFVHQLCLKVRRK